MVLKKPFTLEDGESEAGSDAGFGVSVSDASCDVVSLLTAVRDNWNAICDVSKPIYHTSTRGAVAVLSHTHLFYCILSNCSTLKS